MRIWLAALFFTLGLCDAAQAQGNVLDFAAPTQAQESIAPPEWPARAAERILNFDSDITVQKNGDMDVTETIDVQAAGQQINHGLLRDFPTTYQRPDGTRVKVAFDVRSVTRDGAPEAYKLEHLRNGVRIRIGSADATLAPGPHRFAIRYATSRQIGFFRDFDELYWNVTGNGWTFPIDHASASIHLPEAVPILRSSFYTGPQGARGEDARVTRQADGRITFETTAPLDVREGLTVAAAWRKGVVQPPSPLLIAWYNLRDNLDTALPALGFLLLAGYYVAIFMKTRRRTPGQVVPLYEPPGTLSAPAVHFMVHRRHDKQAFTLAIMELIALRAMRVDKSKGFPRFRLLDESTQGRHALERDGMLVAMLAKLFRKEQSFSRDTDGGVRFDDAQSLMEKQLTVRFKNFFDLHRPLVKRGFLLWLLFLAASHAAAWVLNPEGGKNAAFIALFMGVPLAGLTFIYGGLRKGALKWGVATFCTLFLLPFLASSIALLASQYARTPLAALPIILPLLLLPVVIRSYSFVDSYTPEGFRLMDEIAGFKQYLTLAEGPRLEALATTDEKLQVYERYLPYAIALGVGSKWAAAFAGLAATVAGMAAVQAMQQYYGGHDLLTGNPTTGVQGVANDISAGSTSSVSSSSSSPGSSGSWSSSSDSSSSGSDGGGSSGDGGGGGGGSGW